MAGESTGWLRPLLWVYFPGHAGVKGNDRADRPVGKATLTNSLLLGRSKVLRSFRHYLQAQSQGYQIIDHLEEKGVERGSTRWSSFKGRERAIISQKNIGTVSKETLGKLLRDGVECLWTSLSAQIPPWTELNCGHLLEEGYSQQGCRLAECRSAPSAAAQSLPHPGAARWSHAHSCRHPPAGCLCPMCQTAPRLSHPWILQTSRKGWRWVR